MSSSTTVNSAQPCRQPPPSPPPQLLSDGLSSLVLSKKYLACARPPHVYKLDHENRDGGGQICYGGEPSSATPAECWEQTGWGAPLSPVIASAVQARYEPSDVFTPLVFEEIQPPSPQPPPPPMWIRAAERFPTATMLQVHHHHLHHHQQQPPPLSQPPPPFHHQQQQHHPAHHGTAASVAGHPMRRPLQHLPPPAQSSLSAAKSSEQQLGGNKPGDLSWLVNFQVASIFEPTGGGGTGVNVSAGEWLQEQPDCALKPKRKTAPKPAAAEQKSSTKTNRKPYRMPPSRLDKANKPGYTYTEMIHQALMEKKELPVAEIYQWISSHFPYFREDDERWKNSVRHNLSINPNFRKGRKSQGAGHYWRLCNSEESLGHREFSAIVEDDTSSPQESSELEQACKYLEGELQRDSCLEDVKMQSTIDTELENEIYTNSFLISNPSKYVNEQINISNNNDFHSYGENILEESIDFQYYNL